MITSLTLSASTDDAVPPSSLPRAGTAATRPLRLQILSDLHFEASPRAVPRLADGADAIVVAGDTCEGAEKAFAYLRAAFPPPTPILTVLGNRAFHGRVLIRELTIARELANIYGVTLLEDRTAFIGGVRFIGATMWAGYDLDGQEAQHQAMVAAMERIEDHRRILLTDKPRSRPFTPKHAMALFQESTARILTALGRTWDGPTVVVTHHAPSALSLGPQRDMAVPAAAYASRLDAMVRGSGAALWVHGHIHSSCDYRLGKTRVLCNPRGSGEENPAYDPTLVVEVPRR